MERLWQILEPGQPGDRTSQLFDVSILSLIALNVAALIAGSVETIDARYGDLLARFELISLVVFTIEYGLRLLSCIADPRFASPVAGRIRFALRPLPLLDLVVILPFLLQIFGVDLRYLRALRLVRIVRVGKLVRYVETLRLLADVFRAKREELILSSAIMFLLLILSSCVMYQVENDAQPEHFPSIPATMWWAVATLSTVGYGDVYPITPIGRFLGAFVAILGIGFFALPTGILGSGFVEEIEKRKKERHCPHCGEKLRSDGN